MEWNKDQCLQFIEDYRLYPELWPSTDKDYKNKQKRTDALQKLAQKYSSDSKGILKKIKSLRSYFHKEHSKVLNKKVVRELMMYSVQAGLHTSNSCLFWKQISQGLADNNDVSFIITT
jgi:hypothetical protein